MKDNLLTFAGAIVGGALGFLAFHLLLTQGLYGLVLPGGLLGIGAGFAKNRSIFVAIFCGIAALMLGLVAEWYESPFIVDRSFSYFITHPFDLQPATLVMIALGAVIGFWVPFRQLARPAK